MEKNRKLTWDEQAVISLSKSLNWISESSIQQAELVEQAILETIDAICIHPERYPPDKYKSNNGGNYRAFETHSYRVSYYHSDSEVRILRIRHVKQNPKAH